MKNNANRNAEIKLKISRIVVYTILIFLSFLCLFFLCEVVGIDRFAEDEKPLIRKFRREVQQHVDRGHKVFVPVQFVREIVLQKR